MSQYERDAIEAHKQYFDLFAAPHRSDAEQIAVRPDGSDLPGADYERGRADERRRCAEIDEETGNAERRAALLREEYDRGRADGRVEERAAIVAGLTARVEDKEGSITPHTQPESRRNLASQANELSNVIVLLKAGEWSAKP